VIYLPLDAVKGVQATLILNYLQLIPFQYNPLVSPIYPLQAHRQGPVFSVLILNMN